MKPMAMLLGILFAQTALAQPINPDALPPDKSFKISGKVGYGCGPTHGSG